MDDKPNGNGVMETTVPTDGPGPVSPEIAALAAQLGQISGPIKTVVDAAGRHEEPLPDQAGDAGGVRRRREEGAHGRPSGAEGDGGDPTATVRSAGERWERSSSRGASSGTR